MAAGHAADKLDVGGEGGAESERPPVERRELEAVVQHGHSQQDKHQKPNEEPPPQKGSLSCQKHGRSTDCHGHHSAAL